MKAERREAFMGQAALAAGPPGSGRSPVAEGVA